jgi:hypothetical protein
LVRSAFLFDSFGIYEMSSFKNDGRTKSEIDSLVKRMKRGQKFTRKGGIAEKGL